MMWWFEPIPWWMPALGVLLISAGTGFLSGLILDAWRNRESRQPPR